MNSFYLYRESFLEGFYFSLSEERMNSSVPNVDYKDMQSIGYYDGYSHGSSRLSFGKKNIVCSLLEDTINKKYVNALVLFKNYIYKYDTYKSGFETGYREAVEKNNSNDEEFNVIPSLDDNDVYSIGYYDGYCYYLNRTLNNYSEELENTDSVSGDSIDIILIESYKKSFQMYPIFSEGEVKEKKI